MIYYTSDLHLFHKNILKFDNRPFSNLEEMHEALIQNWNDVVQPEDEIYILGDFCWGKENTWQEILPKLNGKKTLIKGNHDLKSMTPSTKKYFQDVKDYKEITDNGRRVILSHYPILFYRSAWNDNIYHLYGHVHNTLEHDFIENIRKYIQNNDDRIAKHKCQFYNCWIGFYDWKPVTLDQIIAKWE